jgi:hypothetical protein
MTMGLKVRALFDDEDIKKKAKKRKKESDAVLEKIYDLLLEKKSGKAIDSDIIKNKIKKSK